MLDGHSPEQLGTGDLFLSLIATTRETGLMAAPKWGTCCCAALSVSGQLDAANRDAASTKAWRSMLLWHTWDTF